MTRFEAKRLPRQTGPAGWNAILPPQTPLPELDKDLTAEITIVGGGFAGLSTARRLHQLDPSLKIVLLEAGRFADGSAGRNSGFMIDLPHDLASDNYAGDALEADRAAIALNRKAIAFATDAASERALPQEMFDPCGKYNAAATRAGDAHNREFAQHLTKLGEPHTLYDQQQMQEITGSPHYTSGLYAPGTVMIQPAAYVRALSAQLAERIDVFENSPVTSFEKQGVGWVVNTAKARVSTGRIILANNGHLESFGFYQRQLMHICLYASISAPLTEAQIKTLGGQSRWSVTPADPMGTSVRRISGSYGDRILIRTGSSFHPTLETTTTRMRNAGRVHDRKFKERFPHLPDVKMEHRWAGMLCLSRNGSAAFGELENGVFSACCQNGLGIARGTLQGMGIAELVMQGGSEIADHFLAQPDLPRLPPEPFASLGANSYLFWKEWRSGKE
ncbi:MULTISPECIES: FAD-binding oxidoreductase [unclassified Ruegeria]|uniref:NAD(P)/FAD-dependent oxidoreductase n=1 Tax=unclassified Ruegeria TaxID=2625375 RepID=UPI0014878E07|nr:MULTISPECIES: FAD-binding oxidoreductase [unclassified Ruegeria]NOD88843.1 FAD-dependent oxidoreductase [Ruegeria sp. HKCCD4318]NOE14571.1 FAD-dependent oxidoreductase [Ruegeria sp. HKCCD4318-2]NOG09908.1 FAD-binding oxidoreductase [Ruegeria sp. HKCCD4315]